MILRFLPYFCKDSMPLPGQYYNNLITRPMQNRYDRNYCILFFILFSLFSSTAIAQTGPAGIGKIDGSSTLNAWHKADALVNYDVSNKVSSWNNSVAQSGLDMSSIGAEPDYVASGLMVSRFSVFPDQM